MDEQLSIFEVARQPLKITKKIRLIEMFAGIGAQAKALENLLGKDGFEHYRACEIDKYAMQCYNAIHGTDFQTSDITQIHAKDLGVVDTDLYTYILTYSFPCQDISNAGKMRGYDKGSGTRSGLLWEVERLLTECTELPQILLMENVPGVCGSKNLANFQSWCDFLESLGYANYWQIINAKDYGIPQNRKRCFMVSCSKDYSFKFAGGEPLKYRLCDYLEPDVEEKYYLSEQAVEGLTRQLENT